MRNVLTVVALVGLALDALACGDASSSAGNTRGRGAPVIPNDPSELEGASPDPDQATNPNAHTTPNAPATAGTDAVQFGLTLSNVTPVVDLGMSSDISVTIAPKAAFTGQVALSVTGLPPGVTAAFSPASVALSGAAPAVAKLTLQVPFTAVPSAMGAASALVVKGSVSGTEATANANFKVNPKVTLTIPVNAAALLQAGGGAKNVDGWGGPTFGSNPAPLQTQPGNPIVFIVKNTDSTPHEVHGQAGFAHGDAVVAPNATDPKVRAIDPTNGDVKASGYIHGETNGTSVGFSVTVVKAAPSAT